MRMKTILGRSGWAESELGRSKSRSRHSGRRKTQRLEGHKDKNERRRGMGIVDTLEFPLVEIQDSLLFYSI